MASDKNRVEITVTADLAYLITGLITITQFRLVHRILQGVEHTDPTEWSNSHLSIGDKFMLTVRRTVSVQRLFAFLLDNDSKFGHGCFIMRRLRNISFQDGSAIFH